MMKIKKSAISLIVLAFTSLILITGSPFQIPSNLVENNGHLNYKNIGQEAYAADDDGGEGDDGSDGGDDGSSNDEGGGDDGDDNGDSGRDVSSFGEGSDDSSDSNGSDEGSSTSDDGVSNMVKENNDGSENDANIENADIPDTTEIEKTGFMYKIPITEDEKEKKQKAARDADYTKQMEYQQEKYKQLATPGNEEDTKKLIEAVKEAEEKWNEKQEKEQEEIETIVEEAEVEEENDIKEEEEEEE